MRRGEGRDRYTYPCRAPDRGPGRLSGPVGAFNRSSRQLDRSSDRCVGAVLQPRHRGTCQRRALGIITLLLVVTIVAMAAFVIERGLLLLLRSDRWDLGQRVDSAAKLARARRGCCRRARENGCRGGREAVSHIVVATSRRSTRRQRPRSHREPGRIFPTVSLLLVFDAHRGLPGAAVYKAINTADSMIGHRTPVTRLSGGRLHAWTIWSTCRHRDFALYHCGRSTAKRPAAAAASGVARCSSPPLPERGDPEAAMAGAPGSRLRARATLRRRPGR